jgi:hypothetical protein
MSSEIDRIRVPTNGKGPHRVDEPLPPVDEPAPPAEASSVVFTPTQLAVGFGILASLVVLVARQIRRRGRSGSRGPLARR